MKSFNTFLEQIYELYCIFLEEYFLKYDVFWFVLSKFYAKRNNTTFKIPSSHKFYMLSYTMYDKQVQLILLIQKEQLVLSY